MSKRAAFKDLLAGLEGRGLTDFGSVIPSGLVHELIGIHIPSMATKSEFDRLSLVELSAIDYCRNVLLDQGKYLSGTPTGYRVLLPSENKVQVGNYMSSADRKLSRALKLSRNSPMQDVARSDQTEARILMKRSGMRFSLQPSSIQPESPAHV